MNESFIQGAGFAAACMIMGHFLSCLSDIIHIFLKEYSEKRKEMKDNDRIKFKR